MARSLQKQTWLQGIPRQTLQLYTLGILWLPCLAGNWSPDGTGSNEEVSILWMAQHLTPAPGLSADSMALKEHTLRLHLQGSSSHATK